jgi:hypothetical protein
MYPHVGYFRATRHPWPCWLFVLPLLLAYEGGVVWLGGAHPEALRNGADHWMRTGLQTLGLAWPWLPPALLAAVFGVWVLARRADQPGDLVGVLSGMVIESVTFALGLWALSRTLAPMLEHFGVQLALPSAPETALRQIVPYLGAGIYEEALFRLVLFSVLLGLLRRFEVPLLARAVIAAACSATLFSLAHHVGPYGQEYSNYLFLFRLLAGLYFAFLYQLRGFGIAVGAHACYNVMVSVGIN